MASPLQIFAGRQALQTIRERGFGPDLFTTLIGAAGGPKWLVLNHLDRVLAGEFFSSRQQPIHSLGSSIGGWRIICYAMNNPAAAIERLEHAYVHQHYKQQPSPEVVADVARGVVSRLLGDHGAAEILANPVWQTHLVSVRSRWPLATDSPLPLILGLAASAMSNAIARPLLGGFAQRCLFHTGSTSAFAFDQFAPLYAPLRADNVSQAILATSCIPIIMKAVREIPGIAPGAYRDGGVTDYHFDFRFESPPGLILYPHYYPYITPGWHDKNHVKRRIKGSALDRVVLVAPSDEFVANLPDGRIPDRDDIKRFSETERIDCWNAASDASRQIADAFYEGWQRGTLTSQIKPLP